MSELTLNQIIKIIIGIFVFVAVLTGLYFVFKNRIFEFFKTLPTGNSISLFWRVFYG
jgi:hypothetical protein